MYVSINDHDEDADVWQLSLPISPVSGAVYFEPDMVKMPVGTPRVVEILPSRVNTVGEQSDGSVHLILNATGVVFLNQAYNGRANEVAYWLLVAADLIEKQQ